MSAKAQALPKNWNLIALAVVVVGGIYAYHRLKADAGAVASAVNPVDPNNVFNTGANSVLQTITGDKDATWGSKIYDWLHPGEAERLSRPVSQKEINDLRRKQGKPPRPALPGQPAAKPKTQTPPPGKTRLVRKYGRGGYYYVWE